MPVQTYKKEYAVHQDNHETRRIKGMFNVLHYCKLTYKQEDIVCSLEAQFIQRGTLTDKQRVLLSDIYEQAESKR